MKTHSVVGVVVGGVIVAALAFYGGMQYQNAQRRQAFGGMNGSFGTGQFSRSRNTMGTGTSGATNGAMRGRPVVGSIISQDDSSMTIKLADGSTKIVLTDSKTIFNKTENVDKKQVKVGDSVGVFGTTNTDGSVTAQNVQLNPQFRLR